MTVGSRSVHHRLAYVPLVFWYQFRYLRSRGTLWRWLQTRLRWVKAANFRQINRYILEKIEDRHRVTIVDYNSRSNLHAYGLPPIGTNFNDLEWLWTTATHNLTLYRVAQIKIPPPEKMQFLDNRVRFLYPDFLVYMGEILLQFWNF